MPIEDNIKCHKCGYNLRGLDEAGVCPECGARISKSITLHSPRKPLLLTKISGVWLLAIILLSLWQIGIVGGREQLMTPYAMYFITGWITAILASLLFIVISTVRPQETLFVQLACTLVSMISFIMLLITLLANF